MRTVPLTKRCIQFFACFILFATASLANAAQFLGVTTLKQDADPARALNIVFVSQGITAVGGMSEYYYNVDNGRHFIDQSPFAEYSSYFNIYRLDVLSAATEDPLIPAALAALPGTNNIYVYMNYSASASGNACGDATYSRVNIYCVGNVRAVLTHELGHAIGGVGDEYGANTVRSCSVPTYEPSEPNLTINTDRSTLKWKQWLNQGTGIDLFQGGMYCDAGVYRPASVCTMRGAGYELSGFCSVCKEELVERLNQRINPIVSRSPYFFSGSLPPLIIHFSYNLDSSFLPQGVPLQVRWTVTGGLGQVIQTGTSPGGFDVDLRTRFLGEPIQVKAEVLDPDVNNYYRKEPTIYYPNRPDLLSYGDLWRFKVSSTGVPTITDFTRSSAPVGYYIGINGFYLSGVKSVTFNGVPAAWTLVNTTRVVAFVPYGATTGKVTIVTQAGTATSFQDFVVIVPPTITSFEPSIVGVNQILTIHGSGFKSATKVSFNSTALGEVVAPSFTLLNENTLSLAVPAETCPNSAGCVYTVAVTNPAGVANSPTTVTIKRPLITFMPSSNPTQPNYPLSITGIHLNQATAVVFKGVNGQDVVVPAAYTGMNTLYPGVSYVAVLVPPGAATGTVKVVTPYGTTESMWTLDILPVPAVVSSDPSCGNFSVVRLYGYHFLTYPVTQLTVKVDGAAWSAGSYAVYSDTYMAIFGLHFLSPGAHQITLTTPAGSGYYNQPACP